MEFEPSGSTFTNKKLKTCLTAENLQKRNIIVVSCYCMYKEDKEKVNHLLLHCLVTRDLRDMVFALVGVQWVMPKGVWKTLK